MDVGDAALAGYLTLLGGVVGALLWSRLNRIEAELASKSSTREVEAMRGELKGDIEAIRKDLAGKTDRGDLEAIRKEMAIIRRELARKADKTDVEAIRKEMAIMRSDLTQVALAVGARRSQASEG